MKKIYQLIAIGLFVISLCSCNNKDNRSDDVVILYTTDVHCGVKEELGYSAVESYKKEMLKEYKNVSLFDAGDFIQGDIIGSFSKGLSIVDIMNQMNYEVVTIGNHEFDYGIDALSDVIDHLKADVVCSNLSYIGNKTNKITKVKPYVVKQFGNLKIGVVGISTPNSLKEVTPSIFKEDGEIVYSFNSQDEETYYKGIQNTIDECNKEADYTVLLTHLGSDENCSPWSSKDVIRHTNGFLAVMDGHSHFDLNWEKIKNKDGKEIPLCDAGFQLNEFGKLIIHQDGSIETDFITDYNNHDLDIEKYIDSKLEETDEISNKVVANSNLALSIYDENGIRIVRSRETTIGNLVADSYRVVCSSDIGFTNGGGVRDDLPSGDITYGDVFAVNPFGNYILTKEVSGSDIVDYLEYCSQYVEKEYVKDGHPYGEFGSFSQVSGLKYTIDTSISSPIIYDEDENFVKIEGDRRVKDVQVLENDIYVDIDLNKTYKVSASNFILVEGGGGANMFVDDKEIEAPIRIDCQVIVDYLTDFLKGNLADKYSSTEGRINVI